MKCKGMLCVAVLGMTMGAFAADEIMADAVMGKENDMGIRITLGSAPGISDYDWQGTEFNVDEDSGGQLEILFARRHWNDTSSFAWIWGAGVFFSGMSGTAEAGPFAGDDIDVSAFGIMGQGGIALRAADFLVFELQPYLGVGGANVEITGYTDGGAGYAMAGLKAGAYVALGDHVELGLEVGGQANAAEVEVETFSGTSDLSLLGSGGHVAGVLAIKF
ncbi:hypothetical protein [Pontiella sp.]|uniref:hypothetical protein n=1 Tax=Pontiella sp. TaxID=2837462 RepID=UPI003567C0AA